MTRLDIINRLIKKHDYKSYLEIGVQNGWSFNGVELNDKTGVDPDPETKKFVSSINTITSDDFFKQNKKNFDIIFIDGLHHYQQVYKDINNSLAILNKGGTIVCHDMLPPDENCQRVPRIQPEWTGDCWKAWVILRSTERNLSMYVLNTDYGVGIIQRGNQQLISFESLTYQNFLQNKSRWMNIVELKDWDLKQ